MNNDIHTTNEAAKVEVNTNKYDLNINFKALSENLSKITAATSFLSWMVPVLIVSMIRVFNSNIDSFAENILNYVIVALILIAILSGIYGYYYSKSCGYLKREFDIYHKQGIWWQKQTALSFSRIQHIDLSSGPLERKYNMATLKFFTAGGSSSDLKIHGLPLTIAEELRSQILEFAENE